MGFKGMEAIPLLTVFVQGLLSFFSPCILPLLPVYISYLAGGTGTRDENGNIHYKKSKVILNTLFFALGISVTFFVLGLAVTGIGSFFKEHQAIFVRIGGIIVMLFGLIQLGFFSIDSLNNEKKFNLPLDKMSTSPLTAFLLGITFSFSWTPCVGPILASVLLMTASAATLTKGLLLIGLYTIGFILPFILTGFFTVSLLNFFKNHRNVVKYTAKIGGLIMLVVGIMMFMGVSNNMTGYLSTSDKKVVTEDTNKNPDAESTDKTDAKDTGDVKSSDTSEDKSKEAESVQNETAEEEVDKDEENSDNDKELSPAPDFELTDQYGNTHKLSDYKGKTVLLNFWATWCPPCRHELPYIEETYKDNNENQDDVIILGLAAPDYGQEQSVEGITKFLEDKGITYPVLMDTTGEVFATYGISSFPTTFMIDKDGNLFGYLSGGMTKKMIGSIIEQTKNGEIKN